MGGVLEAFGSAFAASAALAIPAALLWGVLSVVLSPCHLSSVPLVVAYMSGGGEPVQGRRALALSSSFAAGILASVAAVGAVTAAAGRMLGDVGPIGTWVLASVFFLVGLDLLGILPLPSLGVAMGKRARRGVPGALALGLTFGVALGPCTFAFLAPLLGLALRASAAEATYGAVLVAAFGLGHAGTIAVAGTSWQGVQRWIGSRWGQRAIPVLRGLAGVAVLLGGGWFVWTVL